MTLKKSEKILLQILVLVASSAVILVFFLLPELERKIEVTSAAESLEQELLEKQALYMDERLDVAYAEEKQRAEDNYEYFYSVLNGYSIDEILNGIAQDKNLLVSNLSIGEYEDGSLDFVLETGEEPEALVRSTVNVTVMGSYDNILEFMDAVNEKSTCLRMSFVSVMENENDAMVEDGMIASFRVYLYGVDVELDDIAGTE